MLKDRKSSDLILTAKNSVVAMVATLKTHSEEGDYVFCVYNFLKKGHCTKQSMKTLVRYRLMNNKQGIQIDKTTYYSRPTAKSSLWEEYLLAVTDPNMAKQSNTIVVYSENKKLEGGVLFIHIYILRFYHRCFIVSR